MNIEPYIIRNYHAEDFDKYVQLLIEAEIAEPIGRCTSPQIVAGRLKLPGFSPEQDLFIVEGCEKLVAFMEVLPEKAIGRAILDCWVQLGHRGRGLVTKLLGCAVRRAGELRAKVVHMNVSEDNAAARSILSKLGFKCVRRYIEMKLNMSEVKGIDQEPSGCRPLERGEEDRLARLQNRCYAGTWGFNPNTEEQIAYYTGSNFSSPEDVVLVCEGEEAIGYCWTTVVCDEGFSGVGKGRIFMLGVEPDYRGRGLGRKALLAGLAHLRGKGLSVAGLTVDSENRSAIALYQSVGFEFEKATLWYEKSVD